MRKIDMLKLLASVREYKRQSLEAPFYVSLEVVMECLMPFMTARLVNNVRSGCEFRELLLDGTLLLIMAFMSLLFGIIAGNACSTAACGFAKNLRNDLFRAIQGFSFGNIDKFPTASLVTRLTTDVSNVQQAYMMIIRTAIRGPLMIVFSFIMAWIMGGSIALVFIFTVPFLGTGLFLIARWAMPAFRKLFKKYDALNNSIQENIKAVRLVKAFVREDYEKEKFALSAGNLCDDFTFAEKILSLNTPVMHFCIDCVMIFVLYYGTYKVLDSSLNVGQIASLITYGMQILGSLMRLSMVFVMITLAREAAMRIAEILNEKPEITSPLNGIKEIPDGSVIFQDVSFRYGNNRHYALNHVNLQINSGSTVGITGRTGSSKSTLVQLIPRLYDVSEGVVKVGGHDVREYELGALRDNVAVVLQKSELFTGTIRENLLWGDSSASEQRIREVCKIACADEFIEGLPEKYDTRIEQDGMNLSGGQRQRLCIARALLKRPKILILDNSTSAVDTHTEALITASLRTYMPEVTKIIITQRVSSLKEADKIITLETGKISD
ncbi:MAG: ABC transporter ATP-binding protein [Synergistaceae bacterium]|nr:ABC transporter ATP-binding protein [Synergistaceae bacterium]